ncbi:MAG: F0F1 ATP synthase subunit A [Bacteroidales bacterium]|nr:F0F1 ATP synthase subunit A [Bacteroidales bacterium]
MKTRIVTFVFVILLHFAFPVSGSGSNDSGPRKENHQTEAETKFNASEFIIDHITDSHEWHIMTLGEGENEKHITLYLPVILYSRNSGLHLFSSRRLAHNQEYKGFRLMQEGEFKGKIISVTENGEADRENLLLDFSMTKAVVGMLAAAIIGLWLFLALSRSYRKTGISHPKGIQRLLEPVVCFVRDDIAIPNIGYEKHARYMPYLLSVFFFILINNIMGLIPFPPPFGANVTGNIAVTFVLAFFSFLIIQINGSKSYWRHIFAAPGLPVWMLPLMIPVELIGIIAKPFALMVRLFANITAGHIIVMSLLALIFIFKSIILAPVTILFVIFMDCLELLVAFLQAYVFTLLSSLFISLAVVEEHH